MIDTSVAALSRAADGGPQPQTDSAALAAAQSVITTTCAMKVARMAGHCDRAVKQQTLAQALEWVWKD